MPDLTTIIKAIAITTSISGGPNMLWSAFLNYGNLPAFYIEPGTITIDPNSHIKDPGGALVADLYFGNQDRHLTEEESVNCLVQIGDHSECHIIVYNPTEYPSTMSPSPLDYIFARHVENANYDDFDRFLADLVKIGKSDEYNIIFIDYDHLFGTHEQALQQAGVNMLSNDDLGVLCVDLSRDNGLTAAVTNLYFWENGELSEHSLTSESESTPISADLYLWGEGRSRDIYTIRHGDNVYVINIPRLNQLKILAKDDDGVLWMLSEENGDHHWRSQEIEPTEVITFEEHILPQDELFTCRSEIYHETVGRHKLLFNFDMESSPPTVAPNWPHTPLTSEKMEVLYRKTVKET